MRLGFITQFGPGMGHINRCLALKQGLEEAGHEVVSAFSDIEDADIVVIDDAGCSLDMPCTVLAICDSDEHLCMYDVCIRPHKTPELAWVEMPDRRKQISFGMSPYGKRLEENMSPFKLLMLNENVALGAPGHSSWERCAAGIPTLQITWTESQRLVGKACVEAGAAIDVWNVLEEGPIDYDELKLRIESIVASDVFDAMADNARKLCDGKGVERTIKLMEEMV